MAKYTLKELSVSKLEYGSGAAACEYDGNVRYVRITDITDDGKLANDIVSPSYFEEKHILHDGDILFARTGATVGKTFLYRETYGKCVYAGFLIRMIPDSSKVLPDYIYYFTKSPRYHNFVAMSMKVVAQPNINAKQYGDLEIDIPSFSVQETVVRKLTKLDVLIALRKEQLGKLDELVKARFVEMFGDPKHNEKQLPVLPMTDLCEIIDGDRGRHYPKQEEFSDEGFCLFLNAKNVTANGFSFENCMYITEEKDRLLRKGKLSRGDVVLTTRGTLGNLAFYDETVQFENMRINSGMVILRMMRDRITERFFIEQFKIQLAAIKEKIASGSAQPQLPISTMNKIKMIVPEVKQQKYYADFVEQTNKSKLTIQASLDKLEVMKKALMQEYFG